MDFSFLYDPNVIAFYLAIVVFIVWELIKKKKEVSTKVIFMVNALIGVVYATLMVAMFGGDIESFIAKFFIVVGTGSIYKFFQYIGVIPKDE